MINSVLLLLKSKAIKEKNCQINLVMFTTQLVEMKQTKAGYTERNRNVLTKTIFNQ